MPEQDQGLQNPDSEELKEQFQDNPEMLELLSTASINFGPVHTKILGIAKTISKSNPNQWAVQNNEAQIADSKLRTNVDSRTAEVKRKLQDDVIKPAIAILTEAVRNFDGKATLFASATTVDGEVINTDGFVNVDRNNAEASIVIETVNEEGDLIGPSVGIICKISGTKLIPNTRMDIHFKGKDSMICKLS